MAWKEVIEVETVYGLVSVSLSNHFSGHGFVRARADIRLLSNPDRYQSFVGSVEYVSASVGDYLLKEFGYPHQQPCFMEEQ